MWLKEQGSAENKLNLFSSKSLTMEELEKEVANKKGTEPFPVILPSLSKLLQIGNIKSIIQFVNSLQRNKSVKHIFVISSVHILPQEYSFVVAFLEHMSNIFVTFFKDHLSILSRQPGGAVSNKSYTYTINKTEMLISQMKTLEVKKEDEKPVVNHPFKIELEEDEMQARNAIKLPYEKTSEADILYTPDSDDDFDEEDPDEDLYI